MDALNSPVCGALGVGGGEGIGGGRVSTNISIVTQALKAMQSGGGTGTETGGGIGAGKGAEKGDILYKGDLPEGTVLALLVCTSVCLLTHDVYCSAYTIFVDEILHKLPQIFIY